MVQQQNSPQHSPQNLDQRQGTHWRHGSRAIFLCAAAFAALSMSWGVFDAYAQPSHGALAHLPVAVRVERVGGFSPFQRVSWAVLVRANTPVAYVTKDVLGQDEPGQRMRLLTAQEYETLLSGVAWPVQAAATLHGGGELASVADAHDPRVALWTLEVETEQGVRRWAWKGEWEELPAEAKNCLEPIRAGVVALAGDVPFRGNFVAPGKRGWVDIDSRPRARVFLNGRDTEEFTPLQTYELTPGEYSLRLVNEEQNIDANYTFKVEAGMTTILDLDLR